MDCKEIQPVHPKGDQSWVLIGRTDDEAETPILWPPDAKSWLIEKTLMLGKIEGRRRRDDRGWNGWMASPTQWTWVWVDSGHWWWTGRPGMLQFMGLQRIRHDWATELIWTCMLSCFCCVWLFVIPWTVVCQVSVHGILWARILEWVAMPSSRGSSWPNPRLLHLLLWQECS